MKNKRKKGVEFIGVAVVFFCHDGDGNFVMAKRGKKCRDECGKWDIGAGAIEFGEDVLQALKKEVKEEFCAEVIDHEFLGYSNSIRKRKNGEKTHWLALDFKVLVDPKKVKIGEPDKFDAIEWFTFNDLPKNLHSESVFFEKYKDKLK